MRLNISSGNLRALQAIVVRELKQYTRYPSKFLLSAIAPFLFGVIIIGIRAFVQSASPSSEGALYNATRELYIFYVFGALISVTSGMVVNEVTGEFRSELVRGTMEQNFLAPLRGALLLTGISAAKILIAMGTSVVVLVGLSSYFQLLSVLKLLQVLLLTFLGLLPMTGLALVFAALAMKLKEPDAFSPLFNTLLSIVMGVYYPISILPYWVQQFSLLVPQTYVIMDLRSIALGASGPLQLFDHSLILVVMSIVYFLAGYIVFRKIETEARRRGDLAKY